MRAEEILSWRWKIVDLKVFFFSSRRRHTRLVSDWSSDVCSSDLYCYPLPTGCYEIDLKVFPPTPSGSGGVQAFTALRKFITITVQRFLRRKRNQRALTRSASLFLISQ